MRRTAAVGALGALVAAVGVVSSPTSSAGSPGPGCADFISGSWGYSLTSNPGRGSLTVNADLAAPSCPDYAYDLFALDEAGTRLLAHSSVSGNGAVTLALRASVPGDPLLPPSTICIYGTTGRGGRVYDRAPDTGCIIVSSQTHGDGNWS